MRSAFLRSLTFLLALALACGTDDPGSEPVADSGNDTADIPAIDTGTDSVDDVPDAEPDSDRDVPDTADDADAATDTGECVSLGCPCEDGDDLSCASGYCIEVQNGSICSELCETSCSEPGYECRLLVNAGGDAVRLCVPEADAYCEPCEIALDCGDLRAHCYPMDDGTNACVTPCDDTTICPSGASCTEVPAAGDGAQYCVPDVGICEGCIDEDGDLHGIGPDCLGADQDDTNEAIYDGAPELCDGVDNDGDDEIDEGFNLLTDVDNCGECGFSCVADGSTASCVEGECVVEACPEGFEDCDGDIDNGCEVDLADPLRCGTCAVPEGIPGEACGLCATGTWTCGDDGLTTCEGEADESILNECGGCAELSEVPGDACGTCDSGLWICNEEGTLDCHDDGGEDARNACGGCGELAGEPATPCGTCDSGLWICASAERAACLGDDGEDALNACGGCERLDADPGDACGSCSRASWECDGEDALTCVADPDVPGVNACGGCTLLAAEPGEACGPCGLDVIACDGPDAVACDGDTAVNVCGGCTMLAEVVGTVCGDCDAGTWSCGGPEVAVCETESGEPVPPSCLIQRTPLQFGSTLGGFSGATNVLRISPANTIEATSVSHSLSPFETE